MFRFPRKLIAILLAVWLPLFSGNALAVSVAMQAIGGECHVTAQSNFAHHDASMHQHMHHADQLGQQVQQHDDQNDQQQPSHKDCGVCQLACCGYMTAVMIEVAEIKPSTRLFIHTSAQFQSFTSAPLVPPPLTLA